MGYLCRSKYNVQRWGLDGKKPQRIVQCCGLVPTGDIRTPGLSDQGRERLLEPGEGGLAGAGVSPLPPVGESRGVRTLPRWSLLCPPDSSHWLSTQSSHQMGGPLAKLAQACLLGHIRGDVSLSRVWLFCGPIDCSSPASSDLGIFPGKNTGVGCHDLLQGIFPIQELNLGFLHCRQTFYHLSYQGSSPCIKRMWEGMNGPPKDVTVLRFSRNWNWRSQNGVLLILLGSDLAFHKISLHCSLLMLIPRAVLTITCWQYMHCWMERREYGGVDRSAPIFSYASWVQERLYCLVVRAGDLDLGGLGSNPGPMTSELCALTFLWNGDNRIWGYDHLIRINHLETCLTCNISGWLHFPHELSTALKYACYPGIIIVFII